jgi:hypothetical protein
MGFQDGYRGSVMGSAQSTYYDAPGVSYPGMLAFASDLNNCDAVFVGETNGVRAGAGVRVLAAADAQDYQNPPEAIYLPEGDEAVAEFAGVVVWEKAMQTNENGVAGWARRRQALLLRPGRAGGRVWVPVKDAIVVGTSTVNWVVAVDNAGKYALGDFCPTALGGTTAGTSVSLTNCKWVKGANANGHALLELGSTTIPTISTDAS